MTNGVVARRVQQPLSSVGGISVDSVALLKAFQATPELVLEALRLDPELRQKVSMVIPAVTSLIGEVVGKAAVVKLNQLLDGPRG